jgi:hypothetical protein
MNPNDLGVVPDEDGVSIPADRLGLAAATTN